MTAPDIWTLAWRDWEPAWYLDVAGAIWMALYILAVRRVSRWPWLRTASFATGILCVLVATQSGIDAYDDRMLSDHMVQHLLLLEVAPLLLLAGYPGILLLRAAPRDRRPGLAHLFMRLRPLTHPVTCLAVFFAVVLGTHVPAFYDATLRHPLLHDAEHLLYLSAGVLMWWPVLDGDPVPGHRLGGIRRLSYVMVAMLPMTLVGAYLNRDMTLLYPAYAVPAHALGISAVIDQQQAGAIMWVVGSTVMIGAGIWQAMAALREEERRYQRAEERADRMVGRSTS